MDVPDLEGSVVKVLDEKDRFALSRRHSRVLTGEVVVSPSAAPCLEVRSLQEWAKYKQILKEGAQRGPRERKELYRHIVGHCQHVNLDGQGRIRPTGDLLRYLSIPKNDEAGERESSESDEGFGPRAVTVIGMGEYLEIWKTSEYEERRHRTQRSFEDVHDELMAEHYDGPSPESPQ